MNYTLNNNSIGISVKKYGAELSSFKSLDTSIEYLWQGNPDVWYGQSPILFPIVGTLLDNKCRIDGKEYEMFRHELQEKEVLSLKSRARITSRLPKAGMTNPLNVIRSNIFSTLNLSLTARN